MQRVDFVFEFFRSETEERRLLAVFHRLSDEAVNEHGAFAVSDRIRVYGNVPVCGSKPGMFDFKAFVILSGKHCRSVAHLDEPVSLEKSVVLYELVEPALHECGDVVATYRNRFSANFEFVRKLFEHFFRVGEIFQSFGVFSLDGSEGVGFHVFRIACRSYSIYHMTFARTNRPIYSYDESGSSRNLFSFLRNSKRLA